MTSASDALPFDLATAHAMLAAERAARQQAETAAAQAQAEAANAVADRSSNEALIAHLKLEIEKLRRQLYGQRSERKVRLLDQLELQLEKAEASATEDELVAEEAAKQMQTVRSFTRRRPVRKPFPEDIERERVVLAASTSCPCCGSAKLSKLGEDVTQTLEIVPRRWKLIETVREKFLCRACQTIRQPPAALPCDAARLYRAPAAGDDPVRHRAHDQWAKCRRASAGAPGEEPAAGGRAPDVAARTARRLVTLGRGDQAYRLHAEALGSLHPLPRRWSDLLDEQRGGTCPARPGPGQKGVAVRGVRSRRRSGGRHVLADHDGKAQRR